MRCGRRGLTSEPDLAYPYMTLSEMKSLQLKAGDSKLKTWLALDPKYQPARAIHEGLDGNYYNILSGGFMERCGDTEDLADRERGRVCLQYCAAKVKAGKVPDVCIRSGFNLTHLSAIGLTQLTLAEKAVVALNRVYIDIIKLTALQGVARSGLRGSVVAFDHNSVERLTAYVQKQNQMFPNVDAALETVCVIMLGTKDKQDFIKGAMKSPCLQVRVPEIYATLDALKELHPSYANIVIDRSPATIARLSTLTNELLERAEHCDDPLVLEVERNERIQADDVAGVRGVEEEVDAETGVRFDDVHTRAWRYPGATPTAAVPLTPYATRSSKLPKSPRPPPPLSTQRYPQ